ncbi:MAG: phosphotransferase, partial [Planctomycetota bacterium]
GELTFIAENLVARYQRSCQRAEEQGFSTWPRTVIHADWHPGNLVYGREDILAVIDLDSVRLAPRIIDLAYGAFQFSVQAAGTEPDEWPPEVDLDRFAAFCLGYDTLAEDFMLSHAEIRVLPDLMIENLIAESLLNVVTSQQRRARQRLAFLRMIDRKSEWLDDHADDLRAMLG